MNGFSNGFRVELNRAAIRNSFAHPSRWVVSGGPFPFERVRRAARSTAARAHTAVLVSPALAAAASNTSRSASVSLSMTKLVRLFASSFFGRPRITQFYPRNGFDASP